MTPKEKAQEILSRYTSITLKEVVPGIFLAFDEEVCKKFALILVEEILDEIHPFELAWEYEEKIKFWNDVKQEIEAL